MKKLLFLSSNNRLKYFPISLYFLMLLVYSIGFAQDVLFHIAVFLFMFIVSRTVNISCRCKLKYREPFFQMYHRNFIFTVYLLYIILLLISVTFFVILSNAFDLTFRQERAL